MVIVSLNTSSIVVDVVVVFVAVVVMLRLLSVRLGFRFLEVTNSIACRL